MLNDNLDHDFPLEDLPELAEEQDAEQDQQNLPHALPILPIRNTVLFPGVVLPITVARDTSIRLIKDAYKTNQRLIGVVAQRDQSQESPKPEDLHEVGTLASIRRRIRMPDGSITIIIQGRSRLRINEFLDTDPYFSARVELFPDEKPSREAEQALIMSLKQEAARIIELSPNIPSEATETLESIDSLSFLVHFIASNLNLEVHQKQDILEYSKLPEKAEEVLDHLTHELQVLEISEEIQSKVRTDMDKQQRDYILRQQMRSIQEELGDQTVENEIEEMKERAEGKQWPQAAHEAFEKEVNKLYRINPGSPEYAVAINYIEWLLDLPWHTYTDDRLDLTYARQVLDEDHHGLEKVKDRIIEYLAVLKLKQDRKAPILMFYGPPGVGKTSLGRSIARALNREFVRMSLGGVHDEAEIRGHRRTYIGAMPGRILQGLKKAGKGNPVFMLDEVDKVGNDFRGDPSSALLEVLDPEQNSAFNDHYIELDYDLSPALFIATANTLQTIHPALRDRMEVIEINGYTQEEKMQIAQQHLVKKVRQEHGLTTKQIKFNDDAIALVIDRYTRESGVRNLTRELGSVCRGVARDIVEEKFKSVTINPQRVKEYLGAEKYQSEEYQRVPDPGVSVGLAWTQVGGEILFMETALSRGKGQLQLTGQLGEVMQESARLARTWLHANADVYDIPEKAFSHWDTHVHIPAGSIPKDGPSAGIALLTAMASNFTQRPVKPRIAMTGEITLRGKVMPVGGIKEKVLAAQRAGIHTIILCEENRKDVAEIKPEKLIENMTFHYVERMEEVLKLALEPHKAENPRDLTDVSEQVGRAGSSSSATWQ